MGEAVKKSSVEDILVAICIAFLAGGVGGVILGSHLAYGSVSKEERLKAAAAFYSENLEKTRGDYLADVARIEGEKP